MKINIGISEKNLQASANILNTILADEFVLYTKTRNYHWNVESPSFMEFHKLFEEQYEALDEIMDSVAERIRKLGHYALGSLKDFVSATRLVEGQNASSTDKMVKNLLNDHETLIRVLRENIDVVTDKLKDAGTADFLTGIMQEHEKFAWILRSYLSK